MFIKQFTYLVALATEQHFGRAAARCDVAQPTLSYGIKQLENELGLPIVRRHQRFQGLTPEGQRVLEWAERILADRDAMLQELSEMRGDLHGRLRIGVVPTALPLMPRVTRPFCARHPGASVAVMSQSSAQIQRGLDNFEIDLGITYLDNEPIRHVRSVPLYRERYCLLFPDDGRFAKASSVTWKTASAQPLCLLSSDMQNRRIIDAAFRDAGLQPAPQIETNSIGQLSLHVATGAWCSVVPEHFLATQNIPPGTRALPLSAPQLGHLVGFVISDEEPVPPMAKAMLAVAETLDETTLFGRPTEGAKGNLR